VLFWEINVKYIRIIDGLGVRTPFLNEAATSRELHDLELNMLITRTVKQTKPVTVEYSITEYARETWQVMQVLIVFGEKHRKKIKERLKI
jgi:DNA-binding HxlR family transcriptional regulator